MLPLMLASTPHEPSTIPPTFPHRRVILRWLPAVEVPQAAR